MVSCSRRKAKYPGNGVLFQTQSVADNPVPLAGDPQTDDDTAGQGNLLLPIYMATVSDPRRVAAVVPDPCGAPPKGRWESVIGPTGRPQTIRDAQDNTSRRRFETASALFCGGAYAAVIEVAVIPRPLRRIQFPRINPSTYPITQSNNGFLFVKPTAE